MRCSYDYLGLTSKAAARWPCKVARLPQDKGRRRTVPTVQVCGHNAIFSSSCTFHGIAAFKLKVIKHKAIALSSRGSLATFIRQLPGWQTLT